jgi:hypothetical protein
MASMLATFESSGFLPVGTPENMCSSVDNREALHHCIVDACQTICNYSSISEQMRRTMMRHVKECMESDGRYFGHTLSAVTHILNVSRHTFMWKCCCFGMSNSSAKYIHAFQFHSVYMCIYIHTHNIVYIDRRTRTLLP